MRRWSALCDNQFETTSDKEWKQNIEVAFWKGASTKENRDVVCFFPTMPLSRLHWKSFLNFLVQFVFKSEYLVCQTRKICKHQTFGVWLLVWLAVYRCAGLTHYMRFYSQDEARLVWRIWSCLVESIFCLNSKLKLQQRAQVKHFSGRARRSRDHPPWPWSRDGGTFGLYADKAYLFLKKNRSCFSTFFLQHRISGANQKEDDSEVHEFLPNLTLAWFSVKRLLLCTRVSDSKQH